MNFRDFERSFAELAWFLPPDAILRQAIRAKTGDVVSVGIGVVVPVHKLVALLETEELKQMRAKSPPLETVYPSRETGVSSNE